MNDILPLTSPTAPAPEVSPSGCAVSTADRELAQALRLTYGRPELAQALGISLASLDRLDAAGTVPRAVRIGGRKLWVRETIAEWLRAGAPSRKEWEAMQDVRKRNGRRG
jgi:predicted DNA-binding transcriptional regulator AlpA